MSDANSKIFEFNEAVQLLAEACEVTEGILRTSDLNVDQELEGFFDGGEHPQFLGDLRRFSVELSAYDENIEQYATYLGLGLGTMIAEFASVRIGFLRFDMESVTGDDPIEDRARRFDYLCRDKDAEIVKDFLPEVFDEPSSKTDFSHAAAAVVGCSIRVMTDDGLQKRARSARKSIKKSYKNRDFSTVLTTKDVFFLNQ